VQLSSTGVITAATERFESLLGEDPCGRSLREYLESDDLWNPCAAALDAGGGPLALRVTTSRGKVVGLRGELLVDEEDRFLGVFFDTSAEDELRRAVQRGARMEALGGLTAGIAHDFNNLLTVLVGNLYLLGEELRETPKAFEKVKAARDAAKRGSDLVRQLLEFARRNDQPPATIDASRIIDDLTPLLRRALGKRITLETQLDSALRVRASRVQLESAVVNLAVNARDAIEGRGTVTIRARALTFGTSEVQRRGLRSSGDYVALEVTDTGAGIPPEILDRVFEPFFSTKGDRGTGLGLGMVRAFVEQCGGVIEIESGVGRGTTVRMLLPSVGETQAESGDVTMPLSVLPTGNETLLVCSGDDALQATIKQVLEALGYRVRFAGPDDLAATLGGEGDVDLLLLDGAADVAAALAEEAARRRPGLRIILTSGSSGARGRLELPVLMKPFSLADLASLLREVLDRR
jgi:signal transduction histidine kinase